ncbi:ABC transporter ATP-binding protein [bacterium]|nr:ABC transporter ATP-binding protein [bacterium]NBX81900.1 ABC transporter ATP-binding protein [bacterium]
MSFGLSIHAEKISQQFATGLMPIRDLSFICAPGEFIALLGPSGCGKSTLLRMIAGLRKPSSGTLAVGQEQGASEKRVSYVFQEAYLLPWRKVLENVTLPLELLGASRVEREFKARTVLERVGLIDFESYYPSELSGGMKMRVSLARSLVTEPQLLLLDEPFAALDEVTRLKLDQELRDLWLEAKMTVVFVTHSISEAAFLADRIVMLSKKTSGIAQELTNPLPRERSFATRADSRFTELTQQLFSQFQELEA